MNENNNNNSFDIPNNNDIINNQSQNSIKRDSIIHSKEKPSKYKIWHALYYIFYLIIIISIYILFFINYLKTNNWYEENMHYINLRPISICENYIKKSEACLKEAQKSSSLLQKQGDKYIFDSTIICKEDNDKLQMCLDNVNLFSQRCQMYLNELYLCKTNGKEINKCLNNKNLIICLNNFNFVNITKVFEDL